MSDQPEKIRAYLLKQVAKHPKDLVSRTMNAFGVTRTTVRRHLNYLIQDGVIIKSGTTRQAQYWLANTLDLQLQFKLSDAIDEFDVYKTYFQGPISECHKPNITHIVEYGLTEMINNVIDHSQGECLYIESSLVNHVLSFEIRDDGVGAFYTLSHYLNLDSYREAILDLSKGKITHDKRNHSGEGIFFTSRSFDVFKLKANGFIYIKDNLNDDWSIMTDPDNAKGTSVFLQIALNSNRDIVSVFEAHQNEHLVFNRTTLRIELSEEGCETLVARSQAKRILRNISGEFTRLVFDFKNIKLVGQGFVDQVFRVYQNAHPDVLMEYVNANEDVEFMILRGIKRRD